MHEWATAPVSRQSVRKDQMHFVHDAGPVQTRVARAASLVIRRRYASHGEDGREAKEDVFFGVVMAVTLGCGDRPLPSYTKSVAVSNKPPL